MAANSMGSPNSSECFVAPFLFFPGLVVEVETREWHPAKTVVTSAEALSTCTMLNSSNSFGIEFSSFVMLALVTLLDWSIFTTPTGTNSSVVKVPVLSNRQWVTFPAKGTRKGSVQNKPSFISVIKA
eukprot:Lithocolla_globosa_v1_NODE_300_length_4594_cov_6.844459.p2 type:complete len:127 gc:universal NODE_300_length_4594_cov_6.844459:2031-1651(-)